LKDRIEDGWGEVAEVVVVLVVGASADVVEAFGGFLEGIFYLPKGSKPSFFWAPLGTLALERIGRRKGNMDRGSRIDVTFDLYSWQQLPSSAFKNNPTAMLHC
jgi:hypothetical protein